MMCVSGAVMATFGPVVVLAQARGEAEEPRGGFQGEINSYSGAGAGIDPAGPGR